MEPKDCNNEMLQLDLANVSIKTMSYMLHTCHLNVAGSCLEGDCTVTVSGVGKKMILRRVNQDSKRCKHQDTVFVMLSIKERGDPRRTGQDMAVSVSGLGCMNWKKTATGPDRNRKRLDRSCSCLAFVKLLVAVALNLGQKKTGCNRFQLVATSHSRGTTQAPNECQVCHHFPETSPKTPFSVVFKDLFEIFDFL